MKEFFMKLARYCLLFLGLYVGAVIVVNIFKFAGAEYTNSLDVAFSASAFAFIVLFTLNKLTNSGH